MKLKHLKIDQNPPPPLESTPKQTRDLFSIVCVNRLLTTMSGHFDPIQTIGRLSLGTIIGTPTANTVNDNDDDR